MFFLSFSGHTEKQLLIGQNAMPNACESTWIQFHPALRTNCERTPCTSMRFLLAKWMIAYHNSCDLFISSPLRLRAAATVAMAKSMQRDENRTIKCNCARTMATESTEILINGSTNFPLNALDQVEMLLFQRIMWIAIARRSCHYNS